MPHKLSQKHILPLINFAFTKFVDLDARAKEDEALAKFEELLRADIDRNIKPNLAFLKTVSSHYQINTIALPYQYPTLTDGKSFTRPDGVEVERPGKMVCTEPPGEREFRIAKMEQLTKFQTHKLSRPVSHSGWRAEDRMRHLRFEKPIDWLEGGFRLEFEYKRDNNNNITDYDLTVNNKAAPWMMAETVDALINFLDAAKERCAAEDKLWRAAVDVIQAAPTMEELKKFWPEAALIEGELFPKPHKPTNPVLVINDDTKKLLCTNMGARGVESAACAA